MASGFSGEDDELRIILLGKVGARKNEVANILLGCKEFRSEGNLCVKKESEEAGRKIVVVNTPGWDRVSVQRTPGHVKKEIVKSATLCPPGPHALLFVVPVSKPHDIPSKQEIKAAKQHLKLLSERVWKFTMVLFWCEDEQDISIIDQYIQSSQDILEKCGGRHYVLKSKSLESRTVIFDLFKKIDDMVEGNSGDFLIPQVYYDLILRNTPPDNKAIIERYEAREEKMRQQHENELCELRVKLNYYEERAEEPSSAGEGMRKRRESFQFIPPSFDEGKENKAQDPKMEEAMRRGYFVRYYMKPIVIILFAVIGALMGAIAGSSRGVLGTCLGILIGSVALIPVGMLIIGAARLARDGIGTLRPEDIASPQLYEGRQSCT